MSDAPLPLERGGDPLKRHAKDRKEREIVVQREARDLPGERAHRAAQTAVRPAVCLVFAHGQRRYIRLYVTEHVRLPNSTFYINIYDNINSCQMQELTAIFLFFCKKP